MNAGGAVEPVVNVDIKPWAGEQRYRRISESSFNIVLLGQRPGSVYPADDFPGVNACRQVRLAERLRSNLRKELLTVVLNFPAAFYQGAEFLKVLHVVCRDLASHPANSKNHEVMCCLTSWRLCVVLVFSVEPPKRLVSGRTLYNKDFASMLRVLSPR